MIMRSKFTVCTDVTGFCKAVFATYFDGSTWEAKVYIGDQIRLTFNSGTWTSRYLDISVLIWDVDVFYNKPNMII